jgi:hypothetical protein
LKVEFSPIETEEVLHEEVTFFGKPDIGILKQAEAGTPVPELCREHGMSSALFYR